VSGLDGERGRNRTFNLLIKSHAHCFLPSSINQQKTNNLTIECAHRGIHASV
jgi:hypothetical protein